MHLLRGSGTSGLVGMPKVSHLPADRYGERMALVRPLLDFTKADTRAYCEFRGVTPKEDSTNSSLDFTRNRVRLELLPQLERYNPRFREALLRLSASAARDLDFLEQAAGEARQRLEVSEVQDGISVSRSGFGALHPAVRRHLLRLLYRELAGATKELTHRHVEDMVRLSGGRTGAWMALPGGLRFEVGYNTLRLDICRRRTATRPFHRGRARAIDTGGDLRWPLVRTMRSCSRSYAGMRKAVSHIAVLDADRAGRRLCVRSRRPGDRITPLGMSGSRKVQDVMVDDKTPAAERDGVPLVVSENGVVWVVGHRLAHWARVREDTKRVLRLEFRQPSAK